MRVACAIGIAAIVLERDARKGRVWEEEDVDDECGFQGTEKNESERTKKCNLQDFHYRIP